MYDIKIGQGCGIKATLLTPSGSVCDLRRARYIAAILVLPSGSTMNCEDVAFNEVTNAVYVRLLGTRELTAAGQYGLVFNIKLGDNTMYSTPVVWIAEVSEDAATGYRELTLSLSVSVVNFPDNVAYTGASPKIGDKNTWLVYDDNIKAYVDTGITVNTMGFSLVQKPGDKPDAVMSQAAVTTALAGKVDAVAGKGLSACDYTAADRTKLAGLPDAVYSKSEADRLLGGKANADAVYSKTEVYSKSEADRLLGGKANADAVYSKTEVYSKSEADRLLGGKANADTVYTKTEVYSRTEVDALVADLPAGGGTPQVIQRPEHLVGEWVDPLYGDRLPLYEQLFELDAAALAGEAGATVPVTLASDLVLEPNTWLRVVDAALVADGSVYPAADAVVRLFRQGAALAAEVRRPAQATGTLQLQVRYVKYAGDILTFELKVPEATDLTAAALAFPPLKYFKKIAYTPFFDDSIVGAYCAVWALINHKRIYNTPGKFFFHKGWTPSASDTFELKAHPLDFDNGTGRRIRYGFMNSIWPLWGNEYAPRLIRDSSDSTYNPYVCWDELAVMCDYGCGCAYHNVDERVYDKTDPAQILRGIAADRQRCHEKLGIRMKIMAQPDGNGAYITAAQQSGPLVLFSRNSSPMGPKLYTTPVQDLYHKNYGGGSGNSDTGNWKTSIREQLAADDPWCLVTVRHTTNWDNEQLPFLEWLYDNYSGTPDSDLVWVTAADNLYEWMHTRLHGSVEVLSDSVRTEGGFKYVPCRVLIPGRESFDHRDASLLFTAAALPTTCEVVGCSGNVLRAECAIATDGVRLNLNFDPKTLERAERYTAQFEASADDLDRESARYFVSWLSDELAAPFLERIDAVRNVPITSLEIGGPVTLSVGASGTYTVTALPADNTQMERIALTLPAGLELVSRSVAGNVLTASIRGVAEGAAVFTVACGEIRDTYNVSVEAAPVPLDIPITSIEIIGAVSITDAGQRLFKITCLPENNTQTPQVQVSVTGGIRLVGTTVAANIITATVEATANGPATLRASVGEVSGAKELVVSGIETPALRIVASFGYDYKVATGGVYDAIGGYTKIRPTSSALSGSLYDTAGNETGTYTLSGMPKIPGVSSQGPVTGDDSALYKDYAIQSDIYAGPDLEARMTITFAGLPAGRYRMRYFLNTANATLSKGAVLARWKYTTSEGEYPIVMPSDIAYWVNNWQRYVDTEVTVGSNGVCSLSVDAAGNASTSAPVQIIDIEKTGDQPAEPYYLKLNGADQDLSRTDLPAAGATLALAIESNATPRIVSQDARLTTALSEAKDMLTITVPANTTTSAVGYDPVVLGVDEEPALRRQVTILQKGVAPAPIVYSVVLKNDTNARMTFIDSRRARFQIDPKYDQTVSIGTETCSITFDKALSTVAISPVGIGQNAVWGGGSIGAGTAAMIDTTQWLAACAAGNRTFSVHG